MTNIIYQNLNFRHALAAFAVFISMISTMDATVMIQPSNNAEAAEPYPVLDIGNNVLALSLYLPDNETGFVRGQRFDPSSMVHSLTFEGHTVFGSFMEKPDPASMLNASGFAEEFGIEFPPGYIGAKAGAVFLKIGVGALRRTSDAPYHFYDTYPVVSSPSWRFEQLDKQSIRFIHTLEDVEGWAYHYERSVVVHPREPVIIVERSLRNDGSRNILTRHYAHNMFRVDDGPVGQGYSLETSFHLPLEPFPLPNDQGHLKNQGNRLCLVKPLDKALFWRGAVLVPETAHRFQFEHAGSGIVMEVTGDTPIDAFALHLHPRAFSAEPFTRIAVAPGETFSWCSIYRFSKTSPNKEPD